MKPLLTASEVSALLRVCPQHVYELAAARKLPSFKIPGVGLRFSEDEILRWLADGHRELEARPAAGRRKAT
jgi:excisionase family DNA binding protein